MSATTLSLLDQTELLQLATGASAGGDSGAAIGYLKEAVSRPDAIGAAHYLLGAEYAQIGLYERASGAMEAAIALDPALSVARLQLGLLWLSGGAPDKADLALAPLDDLSVDDPMRLFGRGLRHLIKDEFDDATACLQAGIAANTANAPLNGDMQRIVEQIARVRAGGALPDAAPPVAAEAHQMLLSAYTSNTDS
ncbi:MAG TPA: hypothetical protein VFG03_01630 [Telluria sp.]|nr:hypothetical protein [Telluria sp.]